MNQIKSLLLLRANQSYRYLNEIGFGVLLVALFLLTGVIFSALQKILTTPVYGAIVLVVIILFSIELKRDDKFFLQSIFHSKSELIRYKFIENILIIAPIILFQGIFLRWDIVAILLLVTGLITIASLYIVKSQQKERKKSINLIPLSLFEIRFYFEKKIWPIRFLWMLLFLGGLHMSLWILGIVFLCVLPVEIYAPQESREMLNYTPDFVRKKIMRNIGFFLVFISLPTIITFIYTDVNILILLYGIFAMLLSLILTISKKYVTYYGVTESIASPISTSILIFIMLAPGGILITLSACLYYYFQAEKHLKNIYAVL